MSVPNFNFLACLEVTRLVRLARLSRLARLARLGSLGYARLVSRSSECLCQISAS